MKIKNIMNEKNPAQVVAVIVIIIVSLLIGGISTYLYTSSRPEEKQEKSAVNLALSKTISSITVSGKVESINGNKITLTSEGDSITFAVQESRPIYTLESEDGIQRKVTFGEIKQGDIINAGLKMGDKGELEALSIMIFGQS